MSIHEECGVFGVYSQRQEDVASLAYYGLYSLQHRGQEGCGIVVNDDGVFDGHKGLGLVSEVFTGSVMKQFPTGKMAVAHARYGTTGGSNLANCQPIQVNHLKGKLALAHNGNLSNALQLRRELELSGAIFHTTSDTETIAYVITRERITAPGQPRGGQAGGRFFSGHDVLHQAHCGARPPRIPPAVLWKNEGRDVYRRIGELRPSRCRRGIPAGYFARRNPDL